MNYRGAGSALLASPQHLEAKETLAHLKQSTSQPQLTRVKPVEYPVSARHMQASTKNVLLVLLVVVSQH